MKNIFKNLKTIVNNLSNWSEKTGTSVKVVGVNNSVITIDGVTIVNGVENSEEISIGGTNFKLDDFKGKITINVMGDVTGNVSTVVGGINVHKNAKKVSTVSGDIEIGGQVEGSVTSTSGDVTVSNAVHGGISTVSGDVSSHTINGDVETMSGSIKCVKSNGNINF